MVEVCVADESGNNAGDRREARVEYCSEENKL